jgi:type IV pilus assembly protein PilW
MKRALRPQRTSAGLSLVELLVAMAIGLVLTLAIATVMVTNEGRKRTINSVNDVNQTGAYASFVLDRALRSAGTGFAQRWQDAFGCRLNVSLNNTVILPRPGPLPAPFAAVPNGSLRLAPVTVV